MKFPIIADKNKINEYVLYSVYDTETFTVDIVSYEELTDMFEDNLLSYKEKLIDYVRNEFLNKVIQLSDGISYLHGSDDAVYLCIKERLYVVYCNSFCIPIFMGDRLALLDIAEDDMTFRYVTYVSDEKTTMKTISRRYLLGSLEYPKTRTVGIFVAEPKEGTEFGHYTQDTLEYLENLYTTTETLPYNKDVKYIENCKYNNLSYAYLQVKNEVYCMRTYDYPSTLFTMIQTDSKGNLSIPYMMYTKLTFKTLRELCQFLVLHKGDESEALIGGTDIETVNIGVELLSFVVV